MTDVSRIADSPLFKLVVPVVQTLLSAAAIGAFTFVIGSLSSINAQLSNYQTSQALLTQRVEALERARDSSDKFIDSLRVEAQESRFKVAQIMEWQKGLVLQTRPK
ncbi:hypothetical protein ACKI1H_27070 [Pseudomonas sp. YH-1]|uniref:hypothetical protein n=1 Tax=unclassified Pseudomonas TaxID=196821 RepID=UPI0006D44280|nr:MULTISPECIES: hypothetical protein [unclassified Pseudomonas]OBY91166.1 hypothetical protein A6723_024225 [Pseudomonas sp. AU11447]